MATKLINSVAGGKSILLISDVFSEKFILASRNISNVYMIDVSSVNAYDIIRFRNVVVAENVIDTLLKRSGLLGEEIK